MHWPSGVDLPSIEYQDAITGRTQRFEQRSLRVADALRDFPVAVLGSDKLDD